MSTDETERSRLVVYCHNCHEAVDVPSGIPMCCPQCLLHSTIEIIRHRGKWVNPREKEWVGYDYSDDRDDEEAEPTVEETTEQVGLAGWSA